jgi:hypothetical protein
MGERMKNTFATVYAGRRYKSQRVGYLVPAKTRWWGRYDTWVAYDYLWNVLGVRTTKAEAASLVRIKTGVWR